MCWTAVRQNGGVLECVKEQFMHLSKDKDNNKAKFTLEHRRINSMKEVTNRFGTGKLYEAEDLGKSIYCACTACMSVWSDFLSFANAEVDKGDSGKCVTPYFMEKDSENILRPTDTIVVLGCQVTDLAIYNDLKTAEEIHEKHPDIQIFMGGCLAQRFDIELPDYLKRLDVVREEYVKLEQVTDFIDYKKPFWNRELKEK